MCYYPCCRLVSCSPSYAPDTSDSLPAGLVEEKVLLWFFNALETYKQYIRSCHVQTHRGKQEHTEGPAANLRMAIEDILENELQKKSEEMQEGKILSDVGRQFELSR
jgi:hypothetical protein